MKKLSILLLSILLVACGAAPTVSPEEIKSIRSTALVDAFTAIAAAYTPTPAFTNTPVNTNTPEATPTVTNTPEPTVNPLFASKNNGFFLVNVDIAPGVWRSVGTGDGCYWATTSSTGDILANHFGQAGGTAYIDPLAFQVEFSGCGTWEYLSAP